MVGVQGSAVRKTVTMIDKADFATGIAGLLLRSDKSNARKRTVAKRLKFKANIQRITWCSVGLLTPLSTKSATRPSWCPHVFDLVPHGFDLVLDGVANPLKHQINIMGARNQICRAANRRRGRVGARWGWLPLRARANTTFGVAFKVFF